jgi:uncharacterized membrane protein YoaK (UPF0700 family)
VSSRILRPVPSAGSTWATRITVCLTIETVGLAAVAGAWYGTSAHPGTIPQGALIAVCAICLGVQAATVRALAPTGISTTYLTSTLTALMTQFVSGAVATGVGLRVGLLGALLAGAALEAFLLHVAPPLAPILGLVLVVAVTATGASLLRTRPAATAAGEGS